MTHEELLQKLADIAHNKDAHDARNDYLLALRAVVELHTPMEASHIPKPWFACKHCSGYDAENIYVGYPCPTIQAIEKELK